MSLSSLGNVSTPALMTISTMSFFLLSTSASGVLDRDGASMITPDSSLFNPLAIVLFPALLDKDVIRIELGLFNLVAIYEYSNGLIALPSLYSGIDATSLSPVSSLSFSEF